MLNYFTDPLLRAPTMGSMLMCLAAAVVGVLIFVQKRSLLGETLSHATYPGVTLAVTAAALLGLEGWIPFFVLVGALLGALVGYGVVAFLKLRLKVCEDSALCGVLAGFFGIGITIASLIQHSHPRQFLKIQAYLYGQVATMHDGHIIIYGGLSFVVMGVVFFCYKELQMLTFDRFYAKSLMGGSWVIEVLTTLLIALALVIGIRSVGVMLMSAMLIAPAAAARQYTHRFDRMFIIAGFFGLMSGFLGIYLSTLFSELYEPRSFPAGPMIVLVGSTIALLSLFLAPRKGLVIRGLRVALFRFQRLQENTLKAIWRQEGEKISLAELARYQGLSKIYLRMILLRLRMKGWVGKNTVLTPEGKKRGERIIRLHRLWEVYLVSCLGVGAELVHKNAEEMEHILSPELEQKLILLLDNPQKDPHNQPIPQNVS